MFYEPSGESRLISLQDGRSLGQKPSVVVTNITREHRLTFISLIGLKSATICEQNLSTGINARPATILSSFFDDKAFLHSKSASAAVHFANAEALV